MKRYFFIISLLLALILCLLFPNDLQAGCTYGLLLWYQILLPSLLPFLLLTGLLCRTTRFHTPTKLLTPATSKLLRLPGIYTVPLLFGILSGVPVGASLLAEVAPKRARIPLYPLVISTVLSPGFLSGFLCTHCFRRPEYCGAYLLWFYGCHILFSALLLPRIWKEECPPSQIPVISGNDSFSSARRPLFSALFEETIYASLSTLVKIAVYVMIFSAISRFIQSAFHAFLPGIPALVPALLAGICEVTSGCGILAGLPLPETITIPLLTGIASFGGLSGALQVQGILDDHTFSLARYIKMRATIALLMAGATFALMYVL